ncbi:transcription initiation factor IIF, beta subunit-domain-containing protein [Suillus fuscotomentosus]|uniref:Transcription initiation factor IIF subunit beta n=1 Tax=Suillus fuscotomentosus TaxID=1912939 RepID=A0AAD4EFN2_9AGAM|nr:transcription initiation factor IIF, beta subunit-domain-containing protein [Suillus fuscotomentosus]KAG1905379.1 transcription initiation factor IIF, beta subunit-domain-containing protein [Suillus fuscotomentosus]
MDDLTVEDEKKPFEAEHNDEDAQPDPDEELMLDKGNGRVWLVKIPKHLMARWAAIDAEDVHLATIRVYKNAVSPSGRSPRIFLFLPPDPNDTTSRDLSLPVFSPDAAFIPSVEGGMQVDRYELEMVNEDVENQLVVAERPKDPGPSGPNSASYNPRARTTILTGRIKHECNLRPLFNESYRQQMRERTRKYNTPRRQILMIEDAGVSRGGINRLSSGVNSGSFANMIKFRPKPAKGTFERMARMPRNQLLDLLFTLFREQPRWSIKPLRERTQQPEAYLKEVLLSIATLNRSGEYNGMWELNDVFAKDGMKAENVPGPSSLPEGVSGDMGADEYDEDEDDDDDMEEVS